MSTSTSFVDTLRVEEKTPHQKKAPKRRPRMPLRRRVLRAWQLYLMLLLPVAWVLIFNYIPMYGVQIAFRDYTPVTGITGSEWVGLEHFERFVTSHQFSQLMSNTLILAFYELAVTFPLPIILALALNAVLQRGFSRVTQLITYAPNFISIVVVVGIMVMLTDPSTGILNTFLGWIGLGPFDIMGEASWFRHAYVWSGAWQTTGFSAIIYLAALSSISPELHEAAIMDGASRLRRMWHIELPGIMPVAIILLILNIGQILTIGFEKVLLMQNPLNMSVSQVIDTYIYQIGLESPIPQYSYATAIGLFKSVIALALLLAANTLAKRITKAGLF